MTDTALQQPSLSQASQNVAVALRDLGTALGKRVTALFSATVQGQPACPLTTARQEADKLRAYADKHYRADPRYAQDLYAAATRHELAASAE